MQDWKGRKVVIIGAARQGTALARYLAEHEAQVTITDQRPAEALQAAQAALADLPVAWVYGGHPLSLLEGTECLFLSGGVPLTLPLIQAALRSGIPLSNDSQLFLEAAPCRVIGITGSAGKTTTTTLVGRMAEAASRLSRGSYPAHAWVGGNIGTPLIADVDRMGPLDLAVMELSSFQLEIMTLSPTIAVVLNVTPNHLDRHGTMQAYLSAKSRILAFQDPAENPVVVLGRDDPGAWSLAGSAHGQRWMFGRQRDESLPYPAAYLRNGNVCLWDGQKEIEVLPQSRIELRGEHNLANVLAACATCAADGIPPEAMKAGVEGFSGVDHRLEFVRTWGGADWYNDSIATAPERTMAAIRSFTEPIVLLAGGRDKNLPWEELADLVHQRVDHLVLFGEAAEKVLQAVGQPASGQRPYSLTRCPGLHQAILAAASLVKPGDVVLLSPGGTSFDEFRDFEERGEAYRKWVNELS